MATGPLHDRLAETLARNGWFAKRPDALKARLIALAQVSTAEAGNWIYDTGDEAEGLYGVLTGSVTSHVVLDNGDSVPVSISGPGAIFGYAAQVLGGRRVTTVIARERSEIIFVPQHAISAMVQEMPSLWLHFAELATEQLVWAVRGYAELVRLNPRARIASRLHGYSFPWGGGGAAIVPIRQEELAELVGLSRKTVNLVLREFERQKLIERGYRSIKVLDPAGLHRIAMESEQ